MSNNAAAAGSASNTEVSNHGFNNDKGKGKIVQDDPMIEDDEDEDDDEEEEEEEEDEEMAEEESLDDIDPSLIQPRRTRGIRVDYTSPEALAKAGIKPEELNEDAEQEDTYDAKDDEMKDD